MTVFQAIQGAAGRAAIRKRMIVLYWFFHTVLAALAVLPMMGVAVTALSHSRYGEELLKSFDIMWILEIMSATDFTTHLIVEPVMAAAAVVALLGAVFLAGGAVKMLVDDGPDYSPAQFYEGCGRYFWRFLRLMIYSLFFYGIALALTGGINKAIDKIWGEGMESHPVVIATWAKNAILILLCGFIGTAMDYAKVRLVSDDSRKSLRAALGSVRLVWKNMRKTMGAWVLLVVLQSLLFLIYLPLSNWIPAGTRMRFVVLAFFWQQLYVFGRVWLRMMTWGTAAEFYPVLRPRPEEPVPVMAEVRPEPPDTEAGATAEPAQ